MSGAAAPRNRKAPKTVEVRLAEGAKELGCLRALSRLIDTRGISLEEIAEQGVALIPAGLRYPDVTCARLVVDGREYATEGYRESPWRLTRDLVVAGRAAGSLDVCYLEARPDADEGPFLAQEVFLVDALAEQLQRVIERMRVARELRTDRARLSALVDMASVAEADIGTISDHVLATIAEMTGSERAFYGLADENEAVVTVRSWCAETSADGPSTGGPLFHPIGETGAWAEAIRPEEPVILNDYRGAHPGGSGLPEEHAPLTSLLIVPLRSHDGIMSVAAVANRPTAYDQDDVTRITAFLTSVQAIMDGKRASEALALSERRLRDAQRVAGIGIWEWHLQTGHLHWSEENYRIFGIPAGTEPSWEAWTERLAPGELEHVETAIAAAFSGAPCELDMRVLAPDASERIVHAIAEIERDGAGEPTRMFGTIQDITEQIEAQNAARAHQRMNQTLLDSLPCVALLMRPVTREIVATNRVAREAGCSLGETCFRTWAKSEEPCPWCLAGELWAEGTAQHLEVDALGVVWDAHWVPISDDLYLHYAFDVTDRVRAEEALGRERDVARIQLDTVETLIVALDLEGRITSVNRKGCEILGYDQDELIGQIWFSKCLPQPEGMEVVYPYFLQMVTVGLEDIEYFENPVITRGGEVRRIAWHNAVLRDGSGHVTGSLSSGDDITERDRAEKALRRSEALYHDLVETSQDLIWQCDAEGRYTYLNPAWEPTLGYAVDEMLGRPFSEFQSPECAERDLRVFARLLRGRSVNGHETVHLAKDGRKVDLVFNAKAVRAPHGEFAGTRGTAYDVTQRKRAEREVERYRMRLSELAADLLSSGERERRRLAVELHDGVGQGLAAAKISAQQLASERDDETVGEQLEHLIALLDYSIDGVRLLTSELSPPLLYELGLGPALEWLTEVYLGRFGFRSDLRVEPVLFDLRSDAGTLLFRIVRELLNNVNRHAGIGAARVEVVARGEMIIARVEDRGCGFEPDSLGLNAAPREHFGLLSIREEVVVAGGMVEIDTAPGCGTRVEVRIPAEIPRTPARADGE